MDCSALGNLLERGLVQRGIGPLEAPPADRSPSPLPLPAPGMIHEWFGHTPPLSRAHHDNWMPPLTILALLAARHAGLVLWIGRRCWPSVWTLAAFGAPEDARLIARSVLVDPPDPDDALWAAEQGLRCRDVGVVVADGAGLTMAATRRLQLAAGASAALALIARPPWEQKQLSAAASRWIVETRAEDPGPAWLVRAARCRAGAVRGESAPGVWVVRTVREETVVGDEARVSVHLVSGLVGRTLTPRRRHAEAG